MRRLLSIVVLFPIVGCGQESPADPVAVKQAASRRDSAQNTGQSVPVSSASSGDLRETPPESHGKVHGKPFVVDSVQLRNGILEFRQGRNFTADSRVMVFLFLEDKGILPEQRSFAVEAGSGTFNNPHIHIGWKDEGTGRSQTDVFMKDYAMTLEFGTEQERGKLPLTISLKLPDEQNSYLQGAFVADVKGFRIIDGQVDLTSDSFETLKHVALTHFEAAHQGRVVEILDARDGRFTHASENSQQWGWYDVEFQVDDGDPDRAKMVFTKADAGWAVHEILEPHQLFAAHPVNVPDENSRPREVIGYVVARHIEDELAARNETRPVHGTSISTGYNPTSGFAKATVAYQFAGDDAQQKTAFVLRKTDGQWEIDREIDPSVKVNLRTGEIETD